VMFVDSHAHLDAPRFDGDREQVLARAAEAGVRQVVTVGSGLPSSRRTVTLARSCPGLFASVGLHPHEARLADPEMYTAFHEFARDERVVAIGEQGLDFYYDNSPREAQRRSFREQLRLAIDVELPVILHVRDALDEAWDIIETEWLDSRGRPRGIGGVFHCFSGDVDYARRCIEAGFLLGIGGVVTFANAATLRDVVRNVPLEYLVLETDAPYLAPVPHRGGRNEPAYIPDIAHRVAKLKGLETNIVAEVTTLNARELFGLPENDLLQLPV